MSNKRQSNIELLRIAAMLIIIVYHMVCHCVYIQLTDAASIERMHNGLFNTPEIFRKLIILVTIMPFGKIGDAVFILISAYFLIRKGNGINIFSISRKLLLQLGFATLVLIVAGTVIHLAKPDITLGLIRIDAFQNSSWFIGYYFLVVIAAALFFNRFLLSLDRDKYFGVCFVLLALISFSWTGKMAEALADGLRTLLAGLFLYALGGAYNCMIHLKMSGRMYSLP